MRSSRRGLSARSILALVLCGSVQPSAEG
jgi:hypothetical protein